MTDKAEWKQGHSRTSGLDYEPAMSWSEIGFHLGISRQRSQQAFKSGLEKLMRGLNRHDINVETIRELLSEEPTRTMEPDATSTRVHWMD